MFLLVYFQWLYLLELFVSAYLLILSGLKVKNYLKNILIIKHIKMDIKSFEIKTKVNYNWDDIVYINDFDEDLLEIIKRESKIGFNIYYIGYIFKSNYYDYGYSTIRPLYFVFNRLIDYIEKIEGSSDKYLVVFSSLHNKNMTSVLDKIRESIENKIEDKINPGIEIKDYNEFRFNSDIDLLLNAALEFRSLLIIVSCIIEKDNEYYPEIYLDECLHVKDNTWYAKSLFSERIKFPTERIVFSNIK